MSVMLCAAPSGAVFSHEAMANHQCEVCGGERWVTIDVVTGLYTAEVLEALQGCPVSVSALGVLGRSGSAGQHSGFPVRQGQGRGRKRAAGSRKLAATLRHSCTLETRVTLPAACRERLRPEQCPPSWMRPWGSGPCCWGWEQSSPQ